MAGDTHIRYACRPFLGIAFWALPGTLIIIIIIILSDESDVHYKDDDSLRAGDGFVVLPSARQLSPSSVPYALWMHCIERSVDGHFNFISAVHVILRYQLLGRCRHQTTV